MDFNTFLRKLASTGKEAAQALNPYNLHQYHQSNQKKCQLYKFQFTKKPHRFLMCYTLILSFLFQHGKSRGQRWEYRQQLLNPSPQKVTYFYYTAQQ